MTSADDLLISSALKQSMAPEGQTIPMRNQDGSESHVPVETAQFYALDQLVSELKQVVLRLDAIHHHLLMREHPSSKGRQTCAVCLAQADLARALREQAEAGELEATDHSVDAEVEPEDLVDLGTVELPLETEEDGSTDPE